MNFGVAVVFFLIFRERIIIRSWELKFGMLRNNWKPPDYRRAAGGGRRDDSGGQGGGGQQQQQQHSNGQSGPEEVRQLVNEMERQDRRELAGDRKKMFANAMELMQRRKTASKGNIITFRI